MKTYFYKYLVSFLFIHILVNINLLCLASNPKDLPTKDNKLGKRLYFGLIKTGDNTVNCASCHNINVIDTFNWNPSIADLTLSTKNMDSTTFSKILLSPLGKRISDAHKNVQLSADQIVLVREYINSFRKTGLEPPKMKINRLLLFIFLLICIVGISVDLVYTQIIRYKIIHVIVLILSFVFILKITIEDAISLGRSKGYAPLQPIKFSHKIHVGDNKTDCFYCHHTAEEAKSAGIPSNGVCLNCHELILEGTNSGKFEIQKIHTSVSNKENVQWIRIHKLPDHVFFSHAQHANVGKLNCSECHGDMSEDHLATQSADLSMGWCLDCHRNRKVNFESNEYYKGTFEEYQKKFKDKMIDSILVVEVGGENCMKCHY
ncbi:MAG: hypothetical protein MI739_00550 [Bacteroidales bacterium]|nr:hypothetical protein [Bacteroidales bacterium]